MSAQRSSLPAVEPSPSGKPSGWLLAVLLFSIWATIGVLGYAHLTQLKHRARKTAEEELAAIAGLKAAEIARWRHERMADALLVQRTPYAARRALDFLVDQQSTTTRGMFTGWLGPLLASGPYARGILLDGSLEPALVDPPGASLELCDEVRAAARQAFDRMTVVVSDLHRASPGGPVHLSLVVPLVVRAGGDVPAAGLPAREGDRTAAVLVLESDAQSVLFPLVQTWPTPSPTAEALLVRRDGDEVVFLNELRHRKDTALNLRMSVHRATLPAAMAVTGRTGAVEGLDYRGVRVIAAIDRIPDSPWFIVAKQDEDEIFVPWQRLAWVAVGDLGGSALAVCLGVALLWRRRNVQLLRRQIASQEALLQSEGRWKTILVDTPQVGVSLDPEGRVVFANRRLLELTGWTEAEVLGEDWFDRFIPEDRREEIRGVFQSAIVQGEVNAMGHYINPILTRAGALRTISWSNTVTHDELGAVKEVTCLGVDLTERQQAEQALYEREERLRLAMDAANMGLWDRDLATNTLFWSDTEQRLMGYEPGTFPGTETAFAELVHPASRGTHEQARQRVREADGVFHVELRFRLRDGRERWGLLTGKLLRDAAGRPVRILGVDVDITEHKRAEENLRERERQLTTLLGNLPGMAYRCANEPGRAMDFVSEGCAALTGYGAGALGANQPSFGSLIVPEDRQPAWDAVQAAVKARQPFELNYRIRRADDEIRWVWERGVGVFDAADRLLFLEGFIADVTDRQRAEHALAQERTLLRTLVDNLPLGVFVKDAQGRKTLANPREVRNMGLASEAEALGMTDLDVYSEEDARRFIADDEEVLQTGQPVLNREEQITRADGSTAWNLTSKVPLFHPAGHASGLVGISLDITDRKRAEQQLRESEEKFIKAFQASGHIITLTRLRDGAFIEVNQAFTEICGYTREEALASSSIGLALWVDPDERDRVLSELGKHGSVTGQEHQFRTKHGTILTALYSAHVLQLGGEKCLLTSLNDITDRKRAEEALRHALEEKTALLKEVHHRVKNNLQVVSSLVTLQAAQSEDPAMFELLRQTRDRIRSMALLHEAVYRSESLAQVDFPSYLERVCTHLSRSAAPDLMTRVALDLHLAPVSLGLEQAVPCGLLLNELVSNALKHAFPEDRHGRITISLQPEPTPAPDGAAEAVAGAVALTVADDGVGLPAGFDPASSETLGLQLVSTLVRQLHGDLTIHRDGGTTFRVHFRPKSG